MCLGEVKRFCIKSWEQLFSQSESVPGASLGYFALHHKPNSSCLLHKVLEKSVCLFVEPKWKTNEIKAQCVSHTQSHLILFLPHSSSEERISVTARSAQVYQDRPRMEPCFFGIYSLRGSKGINLHSIRYLVQILEPRAKRLTLWFDQRNNFVPFSLWVNTNMNIQNSSNLFRDWWLWIFQ